MSPPYISLHYTELRTTSNVFVDIDIDTLGVWAEGGVFCYLSLGILVNMIIFGKILSRRQRTNVLFIRSGLYGRKKIKNAHHSRGGTSDKFFGAQASNVLETYRNFKNTNNFH